MSEPKFSMKDIDIGGVLDIEMRVATLSHTLSDVTNALASMLIRVQDLEAHFARLNNDDARRRLAELDVAVAKPHFRLESLESHVEKIWEQLKLVHETHRKQHLASEAILKWVHEALLPKAAKSDTNHE